MFVRCKNCNGTIDLTKVKINSENATVKQDDAEMWIEFPNGKKTTVQKNEWRHVNCYDR